MSVHRMLMWAIAIERSAHVVRLGLGGVDLLGSRRGSIASESFFSFIITSVAQKNCKTIMKFFFHFFCFYFSHVSVILLSRARNKMGPGGGGHVLVPPYP